MKTNLIIVALLLLATGTAFYFGDMYFKERSERLRLTHSFEAANKFIEYYQAENGKLVGKTEVLQLKNSELEKIYPTIIDEIRNLKVKPGRVESYTENVITQEKQITTVLRDSVVNDTVRVKVFEYKDEFYNVYGRITNPNNSMVGIANPDQQHDSIFVQISSTDSIIQVVYRGTRYKPWLWFLSRRKLEQAISCKNPNSKIIYSKHIEIVK